MNLQAFRARFLKNNRLPNLPRTGPLAKLPAEIQLDTFYYLDYETLFQLRSTCRYYRNFVSDGMLEDAKESTKEQYMQKERDGGFHGSKKPCYTCYRIKDNNKFHAGAVIQTTGAPASDGLIGIRYCVACGVKDKKFKPGEAIIAGGETQAICKHCKRFNRRPIRSSVVRSGWACPRCDAEVSFLQNTGLFMRFIQTVFAIVIFALSCSGRAVPRSSHMTSTTWRWILTISLVCALSYDMWCLSGVATLTETTGPLYHRRLRQFMVHQNSHYGPG